jgi:hypothetical protein
MNKFNAGKASILALTTVFAVAVFLLGKSYSLVFAVPAGDVAKAYCHAAGQEGTTHFNYHFNKAWTAHFLDNGAPKAGHEDDFYTVVGDKNCDGQPDSTPSPTPSDCEGPCPTASPEPEDDACPNLDGFQENVPEGYIVDNEDNCVPEPTPTPLVCSGDQHLDAAGLNCVSFELGGPPAGGNGPQGQVLGATTMASTGSFTENLNLAIMLLGGTLSAFGIKNLKKASQKA